MCLLFDPPTQLTDFYIPHTLTNISRCSCYSTFFFFFLNSPREYVNRWRGKLRRRKKRERESRVTRTRIRNGIERGHTAPSYSRTMHIRFPARGILTVRLVDRPINAPPPSRRWFHGRNELSQLDSS